MITLQTAKGYLYQGQARHTQCARQQSSRFLWTPLSLGSNSRVELTWREMTTGGKGLGEGLQCQDLYPGLSQRTSSFNSYAFLSLLPNYSSKFPGWCDAE